MKNTLKILKLDKPLPSFKIESKKSDKIKTGKKRLLKNGTILLKPRLSKKLNHEVYIHTSLAHPKGHKDRKLHLLVKLHKKSLRMLHLKLNGTDQQLLLKLKSKMLKIGLQPKLPQMSSRTIRSSVVFIQINQLRKS